MFVIGVAGQAQMGKDTLADALALKLNEHVTAPKYAEPMLWKRRAFAYNVKKVYADTFGVDFDFIEKWKTNPEPPPGFDMTVRQSLQFIGDGFRKILPTIWLDLAFRDKTSPIIISDVRYVNEFMRVKSEGGFNVLVARPDKLNDDPNGSEAQIKPYIEWCLAAFGNKRFVTGEEIRRVVEGCAHYSPTSNGLAPHHMEQFDAFVLNDGTKEAFLDTIETHLVPYIRAHTFDFPEVEVKEEEPKCLISS